jgi:hypothetical protein
VSIDLAAVLFLKFALLCALVVLVTFAAVIVMCVLDER